MSGGSLYSLSSYFNIKKSNILQITIHRIQKLKLKNGLSYSV
jgi:hypothetical protein